MGWRMDRFQERLLKHAERVKLVGFLCAIWIGVLLTDSVLADQSRCAKLLDDFDMADREIARVLVESDSDNSAPRESNRQMRVLHAATNKSITLQLMLAAKCGQLPAAADSSPEYRSAATLCQSELAKQAYVSDRAAVLCNARTWGKNAEIPAAAVVDRVPRQPDSACQVPPCYAAPPANK